MALLDFVTRLFPAKQAPVAAPIVKEAAGSFGFPSPDLLFSAGAVPSNTGVPITPMNALTASAVYACVKVLSDDIAKLPVEVRRKLSKGGWQVADDHPITKLLRRPNEWTTSFDFWNYLVLSHQLRGNGYAIVQRNGRGEPIAIIPVIPDRCAVLLNESGRIYYQATHPIFGSKALFLTSEDMVHVKNLSLDGGVLGISPIFMAQDVFGLALATQKHAATMFRQGTQLSGVLENPGKLSREAAERMADSWQRAYAGADNAHRVAILEENTKFSQMSMTNVDAQLIESRKFSVEEICRIFRVPPHKVGALDRMSFNNIENMSQAYIDDALMGIARRMEEACERVLFFEDERDRYQIRFNFDSLLRGDMKTRYEAYVLAVTNGLLSANECRAREGLPPVEGGDSYRVPLNTGDSSALPSATAALHGIGGDNSASTD